MIFLYYHFVRRVFANGPGDLGSIPGRVSYQRLLKWNLIPPCLTLSIIRYGSRVKWSNPGNGVARPPLHLGVVAIEKGAFGSPSTMVANFTLLYILSFGLVRVGTIRLSARAGAHIECSSRSCADDVTITKCHNKKPRYEMGLGC